MLNIKLNLILLLFFSYAATAQQLVFSNNQLNKNITLLPGARLMVAYKGYNGQVEYASNVIAEITDSSVVLGVPYMLKRKHYNVKANNRKEILIKDIIAFRKRSFGAEVTHNLLRTATFLGMAILLSDLFQQNNISRPNAFLISFGTGYSANILLALAFPDKTKYKMDQGWTCKVVQDY